MYKDSSPSYRSNTKQELYGLHVVEDLLSSAGDWRNIQDIVRLSIRGLFDIVKNQTESLIDLEKHVCTRVSKQEFMNSLNTKANIIDLSRTLNDFSIHIDEKVSLEEFQSIIQDCVTKHDLHNAISQKISVQEISSLLDNKMGIFWDEVKLPFQSQITKFEELKGDIYKRFQSVVTSQQLDIAIQKLKIDYSELQGEMEQKCSKQNMHHAIQSKVSRIEVENLITKQNGEVKLIAEKCVLDKIKTLPSPSLLPQLQNQIQQLGVKLDHLQGDMNQSSNQYDEKFILLKRDIQMVGDSFKTHIEQLKSLLQGKFNTSEAEKLIKIVGLKMDEKEGMQFVEQYKVEISDEIEALKNDIRFQNRHFEDLIHEKVKKLDLTNDKLNDQMTRLRDSLNDDIQEKKINLDEQNKFNRSLLNNQKKEFLFEVDGMNKQIKEVSEELQNHIKYKLDSRIFQEFQDKFENLFESKVDIIEVQNALNSCQSDISNRVQEIREEVQKMIQGHDLEFFQLINKKVNIIEMNDALSTKADMNILSTMIKSGAKEQQEYSKQINQMIDEIKNKCDHSEFEYFTSKATSLFEDLSQEIAHKANMRDIVKLMDNKSNHDEVARAFNDIQKDLVRKINIEELRQIQSDQAVVNESLCTENIVARWTYKQSPLCPGSLVPWNSQVVNTLSENFLWERDKPSIIVVAPGLYELTLGFYAKKKPKVDVLVNGEIIIGAVNSGSYVVHHSSGKLKDTKHSSGCITGLTMIDFVVLPARARLSIGYQGELGEGFLGLRRL